MLPPIRYLVSRVLPSLLLSLLLLGGSGAVPATVALAGAAGASDEVLRLLARRFDDTRAFLPAARFRERPTNLPGRRDALQLTSGDLISAVADPSGVLRITLEPNVRVRKVKLESAFVPRNVDYDSERGIIAIAAVSQVVLYAASDGDVTAITGPNDEVSFGFVNDVLFDGQGGLYLADMGDKRTLQEPYDGRLWRLDLDTGEIVRVAGRRKLSNPRFLMLDESGTVFFVDGESGPYLSARLNLRYDRILRVSSKNKRRATVMYGGSGLVTSAAKAAPDGTFWLGTVVDFAILTGTVVTWPCGVMTPFELVTSLEFDLTGQALVMDGSSVTGLPRTIYQVDAECGVVKRAGSPKTRRARGLAIVP